MVGAAAAPGIVRPLRPPQLLEIAILRFGVIAREPGYAEQSTSPIRGIRRRLRNFGYPIVWNDVCAVALTPWELLILHYPGFWWHRGNFLATAALAHACR